MTASPQEDHSPLCASVPLLLELDYEVSPAGSGVSAWSPAGGTLLGGGRNLKISV